MRKTSIFLALLALSASLTGCGRGVNNGVAPTMVGAQSYATTNSYLGSTPTVRTNGTAQATAGGRAVATATGYVYEQNAVTNAPGYNFYNAQNPCLYPRPGQTVSCGTASGVNSGYYTGQQPTTATGVAGMASSYGSGYAMPSGTTPAPAYGTTPNAYGTTPAATSPYGTPAATNPYGTATTNPYGTAPATSSYGTPSSYGTAPATTSPYGTPAATNPYGTGTTTPSTYTGQSAPQTSSADRARSRIDTSSSSTSTGSTGKKGVSF